MFGGYKLQRSSTVGFLSQKEGTKIASRQVMNPLWVGDGTLQLELLPASFAKPCVCTRQDPEAEIGLSMEEEGGRSHDWETLECLIPVQP